MSSQKNLQLGEAEHVQEGEANPWLKGFCRLHYAIRSLVPFLSPVDVQSTRMAGGDSWRGECWQLRFTELALALKAEGWAAISGKAR